MTSLREQINPGSRIKIYLILIFVSIILFVLSVHQAYPIEVQASDPLGLMSKMPLTYWAGLAMLVVASILAFLDNELKSEAIHMLLLMTLGLFLVGVVVFGCPNAANPNDYYFMGQVKTVLAAQHIKNPQLGSLVDYSSWPAYHFLSASLIRVAGLAPTLILKYWGLVGVVVVAFITYSIGKRFGLAPGYCFLVSFLAISSWLAGFFGWSPRSLGMVLFLLLLMLILTWKRTASEIVLMVLIFAALVITHGLATLAVFPVLILVSIYRRNGSLVIPFAVIFGAWYIYEATAALHAGVDQFLLHPFLSIFRYAEPGRYETASATARAVARYSQLGRVAIYVPFVAGSVLLLWKRKTMGDNKGRAIVAFCWLIGAASVGLLSYGEELQRAYLFAIVPSAIVIALCFTDRKVLIPLMCLSVALFLPANHATTVSWGQVLTTELKGTEFVALRVNPSYPQTFFYPDSGLMRYYNPNLKVSLYSTTYEILSPQDVDLSKLDGLDFVIMSKQETESLLFAWGEDPYSVWPNTDAGQRAELIYENGYFEVYKNNFI